jgi:glycosyltransferase involved in cell wall biosynthesis
MTPQVAASPDLSVVIPLTDARGDAIEHLRTWTHAQTLTRTRYQMVLVSDGEDPAGDRSVRIRHEPELPGDRLAALYRSAIAYVHASAEESFGLTSAEALACGTPVVAASGGGLSEVVDDGITGFLHSPGDADGLAASLRRLIADPELRLRMGASAAERGAGFDRDRMVRDVHDFCTEAMEAWHT